MREGFQRYVICYDIHDNKRRARMAKVLDGYGARAQFSVFEAALDKRLFDIAVSRIQEIMDPAEDRVVIYRICAACVRERLTLGRSEGDEMPGDEIVFIA